VIETYQCVSLLKCCCCCYY